LKPSIKAHRIGETVGSSPYSISAVLAPASVLGNYTITYSTAAFTINKAVASVTPNAASKTYGTADPALSGALTGFMAGDAVTAAYSRTPGETVASSPYSITAVLAPAAVLGNYTITYSTAAFTINKAVASVTPNAASKTYGTADPALSGSLTGFVAGDGVTAAYSRTPGATVAGGPYSITAVLAPASVLGNYTITYSTAAFTINKATPTTTWVKPTAIVYGTPLSSTQLNATFTAMVNGSAVTVPGVATYTPGLSIILGPGNQTLSVHFVPTDTTNYSTPADTTVTLTVSYSMGACLGGPGHAILQPINMNGTSTFKQGSTVPAKFRVCDVAGNSIGAPSVVTSFNLVGIISGTVSATVDEAVISTTPDSSFRWDPTAQQWIFNVST
jgi:MBG domain (YGX type)